MRLCVFFADRSHRQCAPMNFGYETRPSLPLPIRRLRVLSPLMAGGGGTTGNEATRKGGRERKAREATVKISDMGSRKKKARDILA